MTDSTITVSGGHFLPIQKRCVLWHRNNKGTNQNTKAVSICTIGDRFCYAAERVTLLFTGQQHLLFGAIHNSCKPSVKHRYSCFTTLSGGRCPPHSPPAREITSPLTPECRLRRFFIIYLKVNAVAVLLFKSILDYKLSIYYNDITLKKFFLFLLRVFVPKTD